jgi:hypothetical protein
VSGQSQKYYYYSNTDQKVIHFSLSPNYSLSNVKAVVRYERQRVASPPATGSALENQANFSSATLT